MSNSDLLSAALKYAELSFWIFPLRKILTLPDGSKACTCKAGAACPSIGKHPAIKWATQASCDPQVVRSWRWAALGGIGCATGPSGLVVFDADGPQGILTLAGLVGSVGRVAVRRLETPRAKTARGWHVFTRGEAPTSSDPVTKLDVRSTGGFVVLPPSPHARGHVYSWEVAPWDAPIADCPPALLEYARAKKGRPAGTSGRQGVKVVNMGRPPEGEAGGVTLPAWLECATPDFGERLEQVLNEPDWAEVERALACVPAACSMDQWLRIGMALHQAGNGALQALDMWDKWASTSKGVGVGNGEYCGREASEYKWTTFQKREEGVGLGSLFVIATQHGYNRREVMPDESGRRTLPRTFETRPPDDVRVPGADKTFESKELDEKLEEKPHVNGTTYTLPEHITRADPIWVDWTGEGEKRKPKPTSCRNVRVAMQCLGLEAEFNEFNYRKQLGGRSIGQWAGDLSDDAIQALRALIQKEYNFDPSKAAAQDGAEQACIENSYHPIKNYFKTLQWDGIKRIDTWLIRYLNGEDSPLVRAVSKLSLVAAVRRVIQPGCKFDQIVVLESKEGKGKSTALQILAGGPEYFSDQDILSCSSQQKQELLAGKWIYEISELNGLHAAEVNKVKAFASRQVDRGRRAFGRYAVDQPRTCVFFATTNDDKYLLSQTGNRRFWPVRCSDEHDVDLDGIVRDRDQLWAEALAVERGASLILDRALWAAASEAQDSRMLDEPWLEILGAVEGNKQSSHNLLTDTLKIDIERQTMWHTKKLAHCMRKLGWKGPYPIDYLGTTARGYTRKDP